MTWTNLRLAILGLTVLASTARADQWVTPTAQTVLSPNQKLKAVVTPAAKLLPLLRGAGREPPW